MKIKTLDRVVSPVCPNILTALSHEENGVVKVCDGINVFEVDSNDCEIVGSAGIKSKFDLLKMYVVVDSSAPIGLGINGAVHAAYAAGSIAAGAPSNGCIDYNIEGSSEKCDNWISSSYRNVTCTGTSEDIEEAIRIAGELDIPYYVFHEPDWKEANGRPLAVAFGPEYVWPEVFSKFELHSGSIKRPDTRNHR